MSSAVTTCPICKSDCDITEEDLIDADCGACGNTSIYLLRLFPTIGIRFFVNAEGKPQSIFRCCLLERSLTCREQVLLRYTCTVKKNIADNKVLLLSLCFSFLSFFDEKGPSSTQTIGGGGSSPFPSTPCPCTLPAFYCPLQPLFSPSENSWGVLFWPGFHIDVVLKKRNWDS